MSSYESHSPYATSHTHNVTSNVTQTCKLYCIIYTITFKNIFTATTNKTQSWGPGPIKKSLSVKRDERRLTLLSAIALLLLGVELSRLLLLGVELRLLLLGVELRLLLGVELRLLLLGVELRLLLLLRVYLRLLLWSYGLLQPHARRWRHVHILRVLGR